MLPSSVKDYNRLGGVGGGGGRLSRLCGSAISWIKKIMKKENSQNLLFFPTLNFSLAFVELFYSIWTNSLGLISDSFHMFFDCSGVLSGLAGSVIIQWKANEHDSYGYERAEVLAGFVNDLFLLFIFSEAVERTIEPHWTGAYRCVIRKLPVSKGSVMFRSLIFGRFALIYSLEHSN